MANVARWTNLIVILAFTALGVYLAIAGYTTMDFFDGGTPGSGLVPVLVGIFMVIMAMVLILQGIRTGYRFEPQEMPTPSGLQRAGSFLGLIILTLLFVELLGLVVGVFLFFLVEGIWIERQAPIRAVFAAICVSAMAYLVFGAFLNVPLPEGMLGF